MAVKKQSKSSKSAAAKKRRPASGATSKKPSGTLKAAVARKRSSAAAKSTASPRRSPRSPKNGNGFPVVGIGASAGGLEAITQLLKHLPADTGMAFIFIQHLDPRHGSQLVEVLGRATAMPVIEASNHRLLEPNRVFVLPPNTQLTVAKGELQLSSRTNSDRRPPRPIDMFFESLAVECGPLALGVVLSGTGTDGTLGLTAIKAAGGTTFSQDEASAQFQGMPASAINAGATDFVLPPEQIAQKLARLPKHPYVASALDLPALPPPPTTDAQALQQITVALKAKTGVDFEVYKRSTFGRRVQRRMMLAGIDTLPAYAEYVLETPRELDLLFQDVFIHVTSFFRDPQTFTTLQRKVFPQFTRKRPLDMPVRIWVPGCSTGEEVYSVAIAWMEYADGIRPRLPVQIFGTDISAAAVDRARSGRYSESIASIMSPERLRRFFVTSQQGYQVAKPVRDLCVFAVHNLLSDPPFTQLDLLCCRNVLIYLEPPAQNRLVQIFHYALKPGGALVLGPSEDIGKNTDLFKAAERKRRVYFKKAVTGRPPLDLLPARIPWTRYDQQARRPVTLAAAPSEVWAAADRLQIEKYSPSAVVINDQLDIIQIRGHVGAFLEPARGLPTRNLTHMARPALQVAVSSLVRKAAKTNQPARQEGLRLVVNGEAQRVAVEVIPFRAARHAAERYFLVTFELLESAPAAAKGRRKAAKETPAHQARRMASLEQNLSDTQASLVAAGEELDTSSAELVSALEELQSGNEELQSMNEELQTAKEELQSSNEELTTLNEELENRNNELTLALGNLNNLADSVRLPVLMVSGNMRIRMFNPAAARVLNIVSSDVGRGVGEIKSRTNVVELEPLIQTVMTSLQAYDEEVHDREGRWYAMRIRPYRSLDKHVDGAVITWTDISALKGSLQPGAGTFSNVDHIVETVREPVLVLDADLRVRMANAGFYDLFQATRAETERRLIYELGDHQWDLPELRRLLGEVLPQSNQFQGLEIDRDFPHIGRRTMLLNARKIQAERPEDERILLAIEDVTAVRQLTEMEQLRLLSGRLQSVREEERTRLSREIHDELGGMLTGLKMQLFQVRAALTGDQAPQAELIRAMTDQIDIEMDFVRRTAASLRPHLLDDMGLVAAMEWQLAEFQKQTGLAVSFRSNVEDIMLDTESQTAAFRIFQEALTNVARHAGASSLEVSLELRDEYLQLILNDDGQGISPQALAAKESLGLKGMRERAQQVGGFMDVHGVPGKGTTVRVRVPLRPAGLRL